MNARYFLGVDLGRDRDATALVLVERAVLPGLRDPVTWGTPETVELRVRHAERVRLGTRYLDVVERVRWTAQKVGATVVADATGVGAAVVELLKKNGGGVKVLGVTITASGTARPVEGGWHVSRRDLLTGLAAALERRELTVAECAAGVLREELRGMRVKGERVVTEGSGHDDVVMAAALRLWGARRLRSMWGTNGLGLMETEKGAERAAALGPSYWRR